MVDAAPKQRFFTGFNCNPAVGTTSLERCEAAGGVRFPHEYREVLAHTNGGEGFIGSYYVLLWKAEELVNLNKGYEVGLNAPGLFLFGSDGGGNAFGFDLRAVAPPVVSVPFVGMDLGLVSVLAADMWSFLEGLRSKHDSVETGPTPNRTVNPYRGTEIFEIKPVLLGGDPVDPSNKTALTRDQHVQAVRFWNKIIRELRASNATSSRV
jgi:hypothetical protein